MEKRINNRKRKKERGDVQHPISVAQKLPKPSLSCKNVVFWSGKRAPQYLAAEEGLWQAVPIHHVDQVVQHVVEDAMELLTPQRCALDLGQGTRVQLSLQQGTASLSLLWGTSLGEQPVTLSCSQGLTCKDSHSGKCTWLRETAPQQY